MKAKGVLSFARLRDRRVVTAALVVCAVAYVVAQVCAVFTEAIHWDELLLFNRAEDSIRTGVLDGGGRPGLTTLLAMLFVDGCDSVVTVTHQARLVWVVFTMLILAAVFELVRRSARGSEHAVIAAVLATAALALVPVFMRWSLHVRSDHPAVMLGLWGGVALLASRNRAGWSLAGGVLLGTGYLCSQKALYITALVLLIAAGDLFIERRVVWRRELIRAAGVIGGALLALLAYKLIVPMPTQAAAGLDASFDLFRWYRQSLGYKAYVGMWPTLIPHAVLFGVLTLALARASRESSIHVRRLGVAMLVMLLGVAVGAFHAAAFPYFWITLGVFPAVAIGVGWVGMRAVVPRTAAITAIGGALFMVSLAIPYRGETLEDTQRVQRTSFAFVDSLPRTLLGFHPDGGLVCRGVKAPLPVFIRDTIIRLYRGPDTDRNARALLAEITSRPVAFVVMTHRHRQFPEPLKSFWTQAYVPYKGTVALAGQHLTGAPGPREIEIIVPGEYVWLPDGTTRARLAIGGRVLERGARITLAVGRQTVELLDEAVGVLVLAVDTPRDPDPLPFYDRRARDEMSGKRRRWWSGG